MIYAIALFALLQVADIGTTVMFLKRNGFERNPLVAKAMDRLGVIPGLVLVKTVLIGPVIYFAMLGAVPEWVIWAMSMFYVAVVINNIMVIRK